MPLMSQEGISEAANTVILQAMHESAHILEATLTSFLATVHRMRAHIKTLPSHDQWITDGKSW